MSETVTYTGGIVSIGIEPILELLPILTESITDTKKHESKINQLVRAVNGLIEIENGKYKGE